jgi:hypothetical protein
MGVGKSLKLRIGHRGFVEIEIIESRRMFWNFILGQLRAVNMENGLQTGNLRGIDPHSEPATTYLHHR